MIPCPQFLGQSPRMTSTGHVQAMLETSTKIWPKSDESTDPPSNLSEASVEDFGVGILDSLVLFVGL